MYFQQEATGPILDFIEANALVIQSLLQQLEVAGPGPLDSGLFPVFVHELLVQYDPEQFVEAIGYRQHQLLENAEGVPVILLWLKFLQDVLQAGHRHILNRQVYYVLSILLVSDAIFRPLKLRHRTFL